MYKISISGKSNTGKNTLAQIINEQMQKHLPNSSNWKYKIMAFADPIKEMVELMFPNCNRDCLYGASELRNEIIPGAFKDGMALTYRRALIDIGTGLGRGYNDNIWLDNFDYRFNQVLKTSPNLILLSDLRYVNEYMFIKKKDFYQIRLYRNTENNPNPIAHVSETDLDRIPDSYFNCIIHNDQTIDHLVNEVVNKVIPNFIK